MYEFDDLRDFLQALRDLGRLKQIEGADWDLEIGTICELMSERKDATPLLFDKIKGYPEGYRVAANLFQTPIPMKLGYGIPEDLSDFDVVMYWRDKMEKYQPVPPTSVKSGPVMENILTGEKIDILKFPVPKWHEKDGGRYVGTGVNIITRDPDEEWINAGTYRVQVHDKDTLGFYVSPGQHAAIMREKYWRRGQECPVVMLFGQEPILYGLSTQPIPWGVSELDFAGYIKGRPIEVIEGEFTGLPIPTTAEIAIEGFSPPPSVESREEGPFGEWTGYYASGSRSEPVVKVKAIYHRNDPIINGQPPVKPPGVCANPIPIDNVNTLWHALEQAGIQGIKKVWVHGPQHQIIPVISIQQRYFGHAQQVGTTAAALYQSRACVGRFVIVADDDIDPANLEEVLWAVTTRCDPERAIDIVRGFLTTPLDPMLPPGKREKGDFTTAKVIINACRPYHWIDKFPDVNISSEELRTKVLAKWIHLFP